MDRKTKELIAIGAAVAAHCQPCLAYHVAEARKLKIPARQIREAMAVGHQMEKGALLMMRKFEEIVFDSPVGDVPSCCSDMSARGGKSCCG
jgi:AhpD family alkylhydroperoxidase